MNGSTLSMPQFMADKNFIGVDPGQFKSWLTLWRAVEALPPEPGDMELFTECTGRSKFPSKPARVIVAIIGRRGMKSSNASMKAVHAAIGNHPLATGEWCTIALVCPTKL
ncbi:MAG: hypothetical protein L7F78_23935, partial [Syntrophales bacterium LBB04]|nr:hypothetical protein [Syntrophales bacterium LBB04]